MTEEQINELAIKHCNEVLCDVCENKTCTELIKCFHYRARRAGFYCGYEQATKKLQEKNDLQWHYLKNGDYPPLETDVLICIKLLNNDKAVKIGSFQQGGGLLIEGFICSVNAAVAWQALRELPTED